MTWRKDEAMTDSANVPTDDVHKALQRTRALLADCAPDRLGDVDLLETAVRQRDALKKAGDGMVFEFSHPTRHGSRWMDAIVAYRRVSDEVDAHSSGGDDSRPRPRPRRTGTKRGEST